MVVWMDNQNENYDVYSQFVYTNGTLSGNNSIISSEGYDEQIPRIDVFSDQDVLVVWYGSSGSPTGTDIHGRKYNSYGEPIFSVFPVVSENASQTYPALAANEEDGYLITWSDNRDGTTDVYAALFQPLDADLSIEPTHGLTPLQVQFTDQSTPAGYADDWFWTFGDGSESEEQNPVHTYTTPGSYTVTQWITITETGEAAMLVSTNAITVAEPISRVITYTYDGLYRLTAADYSTGELFEYSYDKVGNPVSLRSRDELPHPHDRDHYLDGGDHLYLR